MASDGRTLSLAELAKLEQAYASNPTSDAYRPLTEAYLGLNRFMEALVVCKKGIKAHPENPEPRMLLARVYAAQGKDRRAIEELDMALQAIPNSKPLLRMIAELHLRNGDIDPGRANLLKAYEVDRDDAETLLAMEKNGIPIPKPPTPPPAPQVREEPTDPPRRIRPAPQELAQPIAYQARPSMSGYRPRTSSPGMQPMRGYAASAYDDVHPPSSPTPEKKSLGRFAFFFLLLLIPLVVGGYYGYGQYRAKQVREANRLLRDATEKVKSDTFAGYKSAISDAENALTLDGSKDTNRQAVGLLAFAYLVRWAEHEHDDANKENAARNLRSGLAAGDGTTFLYAADALSTYYGGNPTSALAKIEERISAAEADKKLVALYYLTRGIIQMNIGALEDARASIERAQAIAPDDPRVYVALGQVQQRRGADTQALLAFAAALKFSGNKHPEALLGTVALILDQDSPDKGYITAAQYIKTLLDSEPPPSPRQLAKAHFEKALLISRVTADLPLYKSEAFRKELMEKTGVSGDKDKAAAAIQQEESIGIQLDRNNPDLLVIRARRLAREDKFDDAASQLRTAIEQNKDDAQYQVELARVLLQKDGGEAQAEESLRKALMMIQDSPRLLTMLAQVQYREKKIPEAEATLQRATQDEKLRNPDARILLGKILRDDKRSYDAAIANLEKASQEVVGDPAKASTALNELAKTYEARNSGADKDLARATFEKALNADASNAEAYCSYGKFLRTTGGSADRSKAQELIKKASELDPDTACAGSAESTAEEQ